ncbi:50S ribosomal protein L28 [Candidatus Falkowbacteria bacterium]|nr:50S ribosomal protein L28 [Candidatus Falkowbacteria bacterium]
MSKRCNLCGRGSKPSVSRSHSKIATKRRLYPNLQTKRIDGKKMDVCTRCLKTLNKKDS